MASFAQKGTHGAGGRFLSCRDGSGGPQSTRLGLVATIPLTEPECRVIGGSTTLARLRKIASMAKEPSRETDGQNRSRLFVEAGRGNSNALSKLERLEAHHLLRQIADSSFGNEPLHSDAKDAYHRVMVGLMTKRLIRENNQRKEGQVLKCIALGEMERDKLTVPLQLAAVEVLALNGEAGIVGEIARVKGEVGNRAKELIHLAEEMQSFKNSGS
ncbi:MAG: hypothetical protein ABII22_02140 [Candidatus Micrarchaeota archaeon]